MDTESVLVLAMAIFLGIVFLRSAISAGFRAACVEDPGPESDALEQARIQLADCARERASALPRYVIAGVGFGTACALLAHVVPPTVAYAILCVALAARCVADQISEERAPRRRSAVLGRSRRMDPVLVIWVGLAAVSSLLLVPWVLDETSRTAALVVAGCVTAMLAVAWRIASASPLLLGNDIEAEQVVDRETRATRTGNTCFLTVAAVAVFVGFSGSNMVVVMLVLGFGLIAWRWIYARQLSRTPLAS